MPVLQLTMPEHLVLDSDAPFDLGIWTQFKSEAQSIALQVASSQEFEELGKEFSILPITGSDVSVLGEVDELLEKEFPKHGGAAHFLMSTLPFSGFHDPVVGDNVYHNCMQYVALIHKNSKACIATCGFYLMHKDHDEALWGGWLVLDSEHRSKGIGRAFMAYMFSFLRSFASVHGQTKIRIVTTDEPHVAAARKIYGRYGERILFSKPHPHASHYRVLVVEGDLFPELACGQVA